MPIAAPKSAAAAHFERSSSFCISFSLIQQFQQSPFRSFALTPSDNRNRIPAPFRSIAAGKKKRKIKLLF
jgi:hypothetical protein